MPNASAGRFAGQSRYSLLALTAFALLSALAAATLTGCGIGELSTSSSTAASVIPPLTGKIMGGQTPILNASVKIYTTGVISTPCTSSACSASDTGYGNGTFLQEATSTAQPIPGIWITYGGSGYTQPPVITFSGGGGGSGAAATAFLGSGASAGQVVGITVTSSGSGYTSAPTVIFTNASGDTSGAGATATTGYGGYDSPGGSFSFAGGYYCPAGEFAYIVASGGQPGNVSNAPNSDIELVAALGRCEDLYTLSGSVYTGYKGSSVTVNEITTVAAAYALGNFTSVGSNGALTIGAPSTNNAAKVSGISTGTTTAAAGLYHAFLNAKNLADPTNPSVQLTAPTNPVGNSSAILPTALMNTIANILANCVNSTSTNGQCTGLPGGADIFTAARTLAANPTLSGSGTAVTNLYNLPTGSAQFSPILAAAPNDYSIAITYPGATAGTGNISYAEGGALDVNDNYYVTNMPGDTGGTGGVNIVSFASNGALNGAGTANATLRGGYGLSLCNGYGFFGDAGQSSTDGLGSFTYTASSGATGTLNFGKVASSANVYATACDSSNNVWAWTAKGLYEDTAAGAAVATTPSPAFAAKGSVTAPSIPTNTQFPNTYAIGVAVDPDQNIWAVDESGIEVVPSNGSTAITGTAAGNPVVGIAFTGAAGANTVYLSSFNNVAGASSPTTPGLQYFVPTYSSGAVTALNLTTGSNGVTTGNGVIAGSLFNQADGAGNVWIADEAGPSLVEFTSSPAAYKIQPCTGSSCTNAFATSKPITVALDSTGSIWVSTNTFSSTKSSTLVQVIGSAAPTWPLLSLGKVGMP